jgi:hypothetical protein
MDERYGFHPWGWDFVALLPFFLDESVVATDAAKFEFVVRGAPRPPGTPRGPRQEADFETMLGVRARFLALVREINRRRNPPGPRRWYGAVLVWLYANQRVYKVKRIVRRTLQRWLTGKR